MGKDNEALEEKKAKRSSRAKKAVIAALAAAGIAGGAYAMFTANTKVVNNQFSILGSGTSNTTVIQEPSWNAANAKNIQPGKTIAKDPSLVNGQQYEAWGFIKVSVPTVSAKSSGADAATVQDVFTLDNISKDFTLISSTKATTAGQKSVYIYGYNNKIAAGDKTTALFQSITEPNFDDVTQLSDSVDVKGYLVQTQGLATLQDAAKNVDFTK